MSKTATKKIIKLPTSDTIIDTCNEINELTRE